MPRAKKVKNDSIKKFNKLNQISQKLQENKEETERSIEKIMSKSKSFTEKYFKEGIKLIFVNHPQLESFSWRQYTPHWNDGDECSFSAHTDYLTINGEESEEHAYNLDELLKKLNNPNLESEKDKLRKKLDKIKNKDDWEYRSVESELKNLERDPSEVSNKLGLLNDISGILSNVGEEIYKEMFGDHVTVIVTKDNISTEEYEHD